MTSDDVQDTLVVTVEGVLLFLPPFEACELAAMAVATPRMRTAAIAVARRQMRFTLSPDS
jgi:hypothetical protein